MLVGVAFLAIVTAAITSIFVARAAHERLATADDAHEADKNRIDARLDELAQQLNRIESMILRLSEPRADRPAE